MKTPDLRRSLGIPAAVDRAPSGRNMQGRMNLRLTVVVSIVALSTLGMATVVGIAKLPRDDSQTLIAVMLGFLATNITTLMTLLKSDQTEQNVERVSHDVDQARTDVGRVSYEVDQVQTDVGRVLNGEMSESIRRESNQAMSDRHVGDDTGKESHNER